MTRHTLLQRLAPRAAADALLAGLALQPGAQASMSRPEAAQLYTAAGFAIVNDQPLNRCRQPARPRVTFVDLNADRRPEALFVDEDTCCYAPSGRYFAVLTKDGSRWRALLSGTGSVQAQTGRTAGWLDTRVSDRGCTRDFRFAGNANAAASGCAGDDPGSTSYSPGRIEQVADLNGDGLPDAVISEGGTYCYGHTGQAFWLVAKQSDGRWALLTHSTGIPEFLKTKGAQNWPDISVGGPGFCFSVQRWNGREYKLQRWEYEGKACKPPR